MSRGLGKLQLKIMELVVSKPDGWGSTKTIARMVGSSQHVTYVALVALERRGLIQERVSELGPDPQRARGEMRRTGQWALAQSGK